MARHDRKHSQAFYRADAHRQGMQALRGRVEFRARRVWVKATDLPRRGDAGGTRALWSRVKQGEFRKVGAVEDAGDDSGDGGDCAAVCPIREAGGVGSAGECPGGGTEP
jgi:hypothetical protein